MIEQNGSRIFRRYKVLGEDAVVGVSRGRNSVMEVEVAEVMITDGVREQIQLFGFQIGRADKALIFRYDNMRDGSPISTAPVWAVKILEEMRAIPSGAGAFGRF